MNNIFIIIFFHVALQKRRNTPQSQKKDILNCKQHTRPQLLYANIIINITIIFIGFQDRIIL